MKRRLITTSVILIIFTALSLALTPATNAQDTEARPQGDVAKATERESGGLSDADAKAMHEEPPALWSAIGKAQDVKEYYFKASLQGQQLGGATTKVGTLPNGNQVMANEMIFKITRTIGAEETTFEIKQQQEVVSTQSGERLWSHSVSNELGVKNTSFVSEGPKSVFLTSKGPSFSGFKTFEKPEDYLSVESVMNQLQALATKSGEAQSKTFHSFDEDAQKFSSTTVGIQPPSELEHGGKSHAGFEYSMTIGQMQISGFISANNVPLRMSMQGGAITVELTDTAVMDFDVPAVEISSLKKTNVIIEDFFDIKSMDLAIKLGNPNAVEKLLNSNHYHGVEKYGAGWRVRMKDNALSDSFKAPVLPITTDDEAVKRYLEATEQSQSDNEKIRALASQLTKDTKDSLVAVKRITRWVFGNLKKESGARGTASATEVLEERCGDCTEHAALSVALYRAAGIPARNVTGLVYADFGDEGGIFGFHAWSEVWLGKWVPVDATVNIVGTCARFVHLGYDEPGHDSPEGQMLTLMTDSEFVVMGHKLREAVALRKLASKDKGAEDSND